MESHRDPHKESPVVDSLAFASVFAVLFWCPFLPDPLPSIGLKLLKAIPYADVTYLYLWGTSVFFGAFTILFAYRDVKRQQRLIQVLLALATYGSIIWKLATWDIPLP